MKNLQILISICLFSFLNVNSQEVKTPKFGKGLFKLVGQDSSFTMNIGARMQFLGTSNWNFDNNLSEPTSSLLVRRARLKFDGFAYSPKLKYKLEFANQAANSKEARIRGCSLQY